MNWKTYWTDVKVEDVWLLVSIQYILDFPFKLYSPEFKTVSLCISISTCISLYFMHITRDILFLASSVFSPLFYFLNYSDFVLGSVSCQNMGDLHSIRRLNASCVEMEATGKVRLWSHFPRVHRHCEALLM